MRHGNKYGKCWKAGGGGAGQQQQLPKPQSQGESQATDKVKEVAQTLRDKVADASTDEANKQSLYAALKALG